MLGTNCLVAEVILGNKSLCPSMFSVTILGKHYRNTNTNTAFPDPALNYLQQVRALKSRIYFMNILKATIETLSQIS